MVNPMNIKQQYAENFYPGDVQAQIEAFIADFDPVYDNSDIVAGIVPHAGWMFSGRVSAHVFASIKMLGIPDTFILFGTVHNIGQVRKSAVYGEGSWKTPFGAIAIDQVTADCIIDNSSNLVVNDLNAHIGEHSIEVQVPFIKYLFPDAEIVPVAVLPERSSIEIGESIATIVQDIKKKIVVVGTTDLTHYGYNYGFAPVGVGENAYTWMNDNNQSIIDLALSMNAEDIITEAREKKNACGSGALAATVAFARKCGAENGTLLDYTTSFDVMPEPEFTMGVGYAGIVF